MFGFMATFNCVSVCVETIDVVLLRLSLFGNGVDRSSCQHLLSGKAARCLLRHYLNIYHPPTHENISLQQTVKTTTNRNELVT